MLRLKNNSEIKQLNFQFNFQHKYNEKCGKVSGYSRKREDLIN